VPTVEALIAFLVTAGIIIAVPGPSVVFAVGRTLNLGRKPGLATVVANAAGTGVWILVSAFGLSAVLEVFPEFLKGLQIFGVLYLAYLGIKSVLGARKSATLSENNQEQTIPLRQIFREGFVVGITNPKVAVFFTAILPQFINPEGSFLVQFLLLGLLFEILGIMGDSVWVLGAAWFRNWILSEPTRMRAISAIGGALIVAVAIWLGLELI
jgi:threonine/homoserine/homoserine lactone efflux protein